MTFDPVPSYLSNVSCAVLEVGPDVNGEKDVVIESQISEFDQHVRPAERAVIPLFGFDDGPASQFNDVLDQRSCLVRVDVGCRWSDK